MKIAGHDQIGEHPPRHVFAAPPGPLSWFQQWKFKRDTLAHDGDPYMHRWVLWTPWGSVRLHHIVRSDVDQKHDHQWDFTAILLTGSYAEMVPDPERPGAEMLVARERWSVTHYPAEHAHRIVTDAPLWTLCFTGNVRREWGFYDRAGQWVFWREYLGLDPLEIK